MLNSGKCHIADDIIIMPYWENYLNIVQVIGICAVLCPPSIIRAHILKEIWEDGRFGSVRPSVFSLFCLFVCPFCLFRGSALPSAAKSNSRHYQSKVFVCL